MEARKPPRSAVTAVRGGTSTRPELTARKPSSSASSRRSRSSSRRTSAWLSISTRIFLRGTLAVMAAFPDEEYAQRLEKTRARMADARLDVLLVTDPANMNYLTGYDAWSFYVPQAVIVPLKPEPPIWVGRGMDAQSARLTTTLPPDRILDYADDYIESPVRHAMQHVGGLLADLGYSSGRIGYEGDAYFFTARNLQVLTRALPDASFEDAYLLVNWVRTVKSAREIEVMRQAARIVERVMRVAIDAVDVGVRECDAAARIS